MLYQSPKRCSLLTVQTQASIATGEVGINILDPDACALDVLGDIFNGFGGRLFDELRSREVRLCPRWAPEGKRGLGGV